MDLESLINDDGSSVWCMDENGVLLGVTEEAAATLAPARPEYIMFFAHLEMVEV